MAKYMSNIDTGATLSTQFGTESEETLALLDRSRNIIESAAATQSGAGPNAFTARKNEWDMAADKIQATMTEIAGGLGVAMETMSEGELAVAQTFSGSGVAVTGYRGTAGKYAPTAVLSTAAVHLKFDAAQVAVIVAQLRALLRELEAKLMAADAIAKRLQVEWQSISADQYQDFHNEWKKAFQDLEEVLNSLGAGTQHWEETGRLVERHNQGIFGGR